MKDIDRFFPAPPLSPRIHHSSKSAAAIEINAVLERLYSLPSDRSFPALSRAESSRLTRPYFHYTTATLSSTLPRHLEKVLTRLSELVGTTTAELQQTVSNVEQRLLHSSRRPRESDRDRDYLTRTGIFEHVIVKPVGEVTVSDDSKNDVIRWRNERWEAEVARREALWKILRDAPVRPRSRSRRGSLAPTVDRVARERSETYDPASPATMARGRPEDVIKSSEMVDSEDDDDDGSGGYQSAQTPALSGYSTREQTPVEAHSRSDGTNGGTARKKRRLDQESL